MTAKDRLAYLKKSLRCFAFQTYPNKQLVVVNEGPKSYQEQIAAECSAIANVKFVFLNGNYTLGTLRNIAMSLADGQLFVQWDDDDFNAPERLFLQYAQMAKRCATVSYLTEQLHYYFPTNEIYLESWSAFHGNYLKYSLIPGTIMAYKDGFNLRYPVSGHHCKAGEDSILLYEICESSHNVLPINSLGHLNVYSFHGKNVWDIEHHKKISTERAMHIKDVLARKQEITRTIDMVELERPIRVMGREGLAFRYE